MSGIDSFVSGAAFGTGGGMVLGATAAANTMQDITERGGTIGQAIVGGIAAGVFETLFETVSIGNMQAMRKSAFAATGIDDLFSLKNLKTFVGNIAKETGVNFTEEAATEIANILYDTAALGDLSNYQIRIQELMTQDPALTEAQAKKIVASELGVQVLEAGLSGALMGAAFGAIDTSIAAYNQIENVKQLASARKLAATLPEAYRPGFDAANVTNETAAAYAVEVYLAAQRYNKAQQETQGSAKTQQEVESTAQAQQVMEEKAAVNVTTLASAQQVYEAQQEAHAQAQAETGTREAAQDAQGVPVLSGYGNAENAVAGEAGNINGGETEADVRARSEVAQLAQELAGEELIQAVGDLANDRRMAGDAQGAAALEKALAGYQAGVYTGENEGGTADGREVYLRDGGEWNDGADSGGAVRSVAENAGRDPGGDLPGNGGRPAGAGGDAPGNQGAYRTVQGSTRQVTGFGNGEVSDSVGLFEQLPPELEDLRQQVVKNGYSVRFTDGVMQFRTKRGTATVDGVYANGEIVVNARSAKWAPEQLVNHEMFHGFARENDGLVDAMVAKVFGDLTDAQIEEIVAKYQEAYKGAGLSRQQALEEICADAFAGMDRKNIGLAGRMSAAREFVGQQTGAQAATGMGTAARAGRASPTSTQTGKAAGSVAGGFVRGEAYSKVSIDGEFYEPSDAQLVRTHKTIHVVPAGNARYASGTRMSKEEYNRYRDEQSEKLRRTFGVYTNRDTAYSDTYGLIEAEIGTKTMRKARSTGGVALLDIMPKLGDIFENAVVLGTKADRGLDPHMKGIVDLLGCADLGNGNIAIVKLNVKEYTNDEAKLYGSRIVEIEKLTVLAGESDLTVGSTPYAASFDPILRRYREAVNREAENSPIRSGKEKETSEPNFSIAGEQARTADRAALEDAREMEKQGMDAAEIFRETGWYMGRDGKWRFELDDSAMRYSRMGDAQFRRNHPEYAQYQGLLEKVFTGKELTAQEKGGLQSLDETWGREGGRLSERVARGNAYLEDILDHPVLFEAYPQLRETRIRFSELGDGENGNYDRETNTITLSEKLRSAPEGTLVHEIQHAIQQAEGFAGGASPEYWDSRMQAGYSLGKNDRKIAQLDRQYREAFDAMPEGLKKKVREINRARLARDFDHMLELEESLEGSEYEDAYLALTDLDWERRGLRENNEALSSRDLYRNTAGEIEARDVSRRRTWDADQRRNTMPDLGGENTVFADGANRSGEYIGKTADGRRVYETDFPAGTAESEKIRAFKDRVAAVFNLGAVELKTDTKKIVVRGDAFTAQKNLNGDRRAERSEYGAKLNALYDMADILQNSKFVSPANPETSYINPEVKPKNKAHKDVKYWYKFRTNIVMDGKGYQVTFNIRDKGKQQYAYLIDFKADGTSGVSNTAVSDLLRAYHQTSLPATTIAQTASGVNSSIRSGKENETSEPMFSVVEEKVNDSTYMDAVERGDLEAAARMVEEAAESAMYLSQARDENGKLRKLYHGTKNFGFTTFDRRHSSTHGYFFFTSDLLTAQTYSGTDTVKEIGRREGSRSRQPGNYSVYLDIQTPLVVQCNGAPWDMIPVTQEFTQIIPRRIVERGWIDSNSVVSYAKNAGYDGVIFKNVQDNGGYTSYDEISDVYAVYSSKQVKSADPIVYDDAGNMIALSARFNRRKKDIRFSPAAGTDYDAQIREYDEKIESLELEAAGGDEAARGALITARLNRSALMQQREAAQAEQKPEAPTAMQKAALAQIAGLEKQIAENKAKQKAEQTKYKKDGKAAHLKEAQRLKQLVTRQRARVRQIKKDAGIQAEPGAESGRRVFRPAQTMRQTENRILDLFRIQAGSRAGMRGELHSILERILMDGYVGNSDVDRALRAMYEAGREVLPAADPVYEDIAKGLRGKKIYVSDEVRAEFGEDWNGVRQQLWGRGIYTSTDIRESGIDSVYAELAGEYPGLFDGDNTDMRGMLEEILEAAQLGRAVHLTLGEAAEARGLTSGEEFEALTGEVMRELSKFADTAGVESRMRERTAQELERQRGQYAEARRKAAERRAVAEQMRKIRSSLNRLNKRARVNDQILSRTMSMQDEATQEIMRQAQAQISTVANRITGKKMQNLLELKRVYEEAQAENPNFLPNPATEKALERVGQVHLQDLSVDELHTLYEAVERVTHDLETQDELIGKAWDDQLDHAADGLEQEIEFSHGAKGEGKLAKLYNEESLSPSRALLRLVGYDRSGIMGKIVKEFEDGDIAAMEYVVGADKIFADFMKKNGDWLKTAAGKKAKVVEVEVPRILAWGEGDAPIYDENGPKTVKIKLTQMMLVQMALDARNEDNLRHIQYGGYSLPDMDRLKAGKTGSAYAKGEHVRGVKLAPEVLRRIVEENLDAQGKEYAQLLHRYYNQFSKDRINRTSRMLDGVDRAMTKEYYPMQSDQGYLPKQYNVFDGTLEGMGSLKERQSGARNAIILGEADATMRWHRDNMARYVGYAVAKRNFEKLLNYRSSRGITIRESIKEKWGVNADAFLSDFMRTVEEGSLENVPDILSSITGNYVGSVLGFNIASMLKQLGAIPMAATKLGTGAMAVGLFQKGKSRDFILKYTPYLESRGKGYTYTEIADYSRKHEGRPSNRFMQTITGQNWLTAMDTAVNKAMWGAAEWYVSRQTNLRPGRQEDIDAGTDLFYQKVAEVFDRATHDTQTNYNLMSRPFALQRKGLRPFVMFRTDAYQAVGMIREAIGAWDTQVKHLKAEDGLATKESVNEAGKLAVRAVLGVVSSNVLSAGIDLVRALLRGNDEEYEDEEGKLDLFRMGKDVARGTFLNLLGGVVFVDTVAEFVDSQLNGDYFFAPELMGVASAEDFAGSIAEFVKTVGKSIGDLNALAKADGDTGAYLERQAEELAGAARDIALAVSQIFGLPLKNMERAVTTGLGLIYPGAKVAYNAVFSDVAKADLAGLEGDALVQGMTEYMRDELLFADEKVRDELVRLYGVYGAQILPGANAPTTRKLDDETEQDLTVAEMGEWDAEYLRTMQKQLPEMIGSTYYKSLSDDEKKAVLTSLNRFAAGAARKRIGMEPDTWVANVLEAGENGAEISDTVVYRALANMLEADRDGEGKAISGSVLKKKIDLLDGMALTDREREAILGAFEQSEGEQYALAVKNGLKWDEYAEMVTEGWGGAENYNKLIDDGVAHDTALDLLEVKAGLEPEEGKTSVTNAQIYEAIAAADMTEAERYDAIGAVLGLDSKGYDKMRVVQDTGLRAADYAALRGAEQEDQYLDAVELGMAASTAYAVVSAVAALPKLPEGERYTDAQRQAAACGACKSTAEQIDAYILYGNATYKTAEKAKLAVAAENYGVTPQMVLEFKELLARHDANGNGSYDKAEKKAALEASGFTRQQKRALWQLHDPDSKSNPFGGAWDIRDAYEEAKEKEKAEKKN